MDSSRGVGHSYILGSLNCVMGCEGACRAKTISVDLHLEVLLQYSVWHSVYMALGIEYIYCKGRMCYGSAVSLSGLNLRSGGIKRSDVMSTQSSVI